MGNDAEGVVEALNEAAAKFDRLCQERHEAGAAEYGVFTFLGNDVVRMMLEELADTTNYCRMQAIKLLLLQEALEGQLEGFDGLSKDIGGDVSLNLGAQSFKGTKDVGWGKS